MKPFDIKKGNNKSGNIHKLIKFKNPGKEYML